MANACPITGRRPVHSEIINAILADWPEAREHGFFRALRARTDLEYIQWLNDHSKWWFERIRFTPDAFLIDEAECNIVIYEAVNSHDVDPRKFGKMVDLAWALDEDCWELVLVRCDRTSRVAYNVRSASIISECEAPAPRDKSFIVPDWKKYTAEYCRAAATPRENTSPDSRA